MMSFWSPSSFYSGIPFISEVPHSCFIDFRMAIFKTLVTALALSLVQIANASSIKRWGVPLPACVPYTPFVYAGCFSDFNSALEYRSDLSYDNMTIATCVDFCKGNDFRYAGLEYYGECFCGATVGGALSDASNCAAPCTGNSSEICGGTSYISIYQDPTFPTVDNTVITDYGHIGCYSEGIGGRALEYQQDQIDSSTITVEECLYACKQGGFAFAGVEFASQCFCSVVLGNGSIPLDASQCAMPCNGNTTELCGGAATIDIYVAPDLESYEPCGYVSVSSSSSSSSTPPPTSSSSYSTPPPSTSSTPYTTPTKPPTTSSTPYTTPTKPPTTSSKTSSTPYTTPTKPPTTSSSCPPTTLSTKSTTSKPPTTTTSPSKTPSLCTSTVTVSPTPTCEYKCGNWCSNPLPSFSDKSSCTTAAAQCAVQVFSCFMNAGWPASQDCWAFSSWCTSVSGYCGNSCPGGSCSLSSCKGKYPPSGPSKPSPTISTTVYTCAPTTSTKSTTSTKPSTTSIKPTTSSCVPIPTQSCICNQPSNPGKGYTGSSPVGSIDLPCLTCNNLYSDYHSGNWFKLYTSSNSPTCPSYGKGSLPQGCKDSCDYQKQACLNTYAESCKSNTAYQIQHQGYDSYSSACTKCQNQWNDCYSQNNGVGSGSRCNAWNSGWY